MSEFTLVIGNKNYSSWSLRPWMLLRHLGLAFDEVQIVLSEPDTRAHIARYSPSGRVPVLIHGQLTIWESIAIGEYLCELTGQGWPRDRAARAQARVLSAEWPMNARAVGRRTPITAELTADIERIDTLWSDCRQRFGANGPWLCGDYSLVDAMYAPVVLRFRSYGATLSATASAYLETVLQDAPLQQWLADAARESWTIGYSEVGLA
jgi:glutathione S-transferase